MRNRNKLILDQLDRKLQLFKFAEEVPVPDKGWIYTIRKSLNMTLMQLSNQLGMSKQGVKKLEERELNGSISLNSLREVGRAFDMKLVYGFSPVFDTVDEMVTDRAQKLARRIVLRTHQNMLLEDQGNSDEQIKIAIKELADEIKREMRRSLWD